MSDAGSLNPLLNKMKPAEDEESDDSVDSEDDDETIARIQRAHFAQTAAMNTKRRAPARPRRMSHKRKLEAVKDFHDFTKKLKKDTGISIRSLVGNNVLELSDFSSNESKSESDGLSEEEFEVNPSAAEELNEDNESHIDPFTGDIVDSLVKSENIQSLSQAPTETAPSAESTDSLKDIPKTLSISDIINEEDLDLTKNVEISEVDERELCPEKTADDLLDIKQEELSQDFDITEKLKEMGEISVKPVNKTEEEADTLNEESDEKKEETEEEIKMNPNALNVRRNIREVMDEKNLDASTLAAQRQESERLARVQEQQRIIREVQRQIAINRQNKIHQKTISLLQGGSSILKKSASGQKLNLPNTVLVKLPSGESKKTAMRQNQVEVTKIVKPTTSGSMQGKQGKQDQKTDKKDIVEIVDSSSGDETSSSSSDSDDCIMLSDSEVPPSPEADEDPNNSGLHVNDSYNIPDEQGRVMINIGHPENEEDIFVAPQIARIIKPHQIGGVRFLFDNIIESVERFSTSTGFGCILAHSMGLGKTLQIVCFCDIFLRHTSSKTVLCIMPINTLQNWVAEFNMWLPLDATNSPLAAHGEVRSRNFPIYVLNDSHKTLQMRAKVVKDWTTTGGVLMIGYELYRLLSMKKDKKPRKKKKAELKAEAEREKEKEDKKNDRSDATNDDSRNSEMTNQTKGTEESKDDGDIRFDGDPKDDAKKECTPTEEEKKLLDEMYEALVKPGPDLVICDEGHRIKNSHSNISYALKQMRTKRRVVLTGYPLQNNLLEYWCMVDFVRPNYLGSKTEFCNMFERPIQNGQCIDSTPQDIRLMRYRAHVLHSLLVGFVQRRSHAVLQSTLPQKEEYVLLVRMTPLQRKLYDRFMNEVVRTTAVPNPLRAFAICCKIWNHPDVLYNFLRKRSEASAAIEEDLDLEEIGGVTKAGRPKNSKGQPKRAYKKRGSAKKPEATIQPNTSGPAVNRADPNSLNNSQYPQNRPFAPPSRSYPPDQTSGSFTAYPSYQNPSSGYYEQNQNFNQNYDSNYYPQQQQQQPSYDSNYPNQYPPNNSDSNFNQSQYWNNANYYGNSGFYNNPQYPNNQPPQEFRGEAPSDFSNPSQYPPNYNAPDQQNQQYPGNAIQPYQNTQEAYANPQRSPYQSYNQPGYPEYNSNNAPGSSSYTSSAPPQDYSNQSYPPPYTENPSYGVSTAPYNQYENPTSNFPNNMPSYPNNITTNQHANSLENQSIKSEPDQTSYQNNEIKQERNISTPQNDVVAPYPDSSYGYQTTTPGYPPNHIDNTNGGFSDQFTGFPTNLETKPPLGSASSGSPVTSWPITELKTELSKLKVEDKFEMKSESDGEVKIEDLDTKKIVKEEVKKISPETIPAGKNILPDFSNKVTLSKTEQNKIKEPEAEVTLKKGKQRGRPRENKKVDKSQAKGKAKTKARKDKKTSKDKKDNSDSEESEKEIKINREEELAMVKKAEEVTYDWAAELLKDYIPGIIENSAKMELFFYILNDSIKMGDRLLLFSQSLFTLNLIENFLERNYIPGTNCLWQRNTSYYRLDGSTHALEREKLINEFNANPNIYLFLVSTRAGSLGINLVGANRVIVFDASWNPCHDTQAVCRVYRYGQKKPCFVYRFVMDWCLEKKIYDRQINKQGMADRVVDECNPDAVLSMKEITNLCLDNDEKESEAKDLSEHIDKYLDVLMQGIIRQHWKLLSKEPFQHESLLVDRKEKKLSSAEKRLAQRGYELEKKAALAPKPTPAYRTVRTADGSLVQRPVASVRPMQHGARWIPADVWRRQGMSAQEMTLPLDVVIPTNATEKTNIVLKAGQRVMVLKSPKGIYMQLESGKIIAIKTSFKGLGQKPGENKDSPVGKKVLGSRPSANNIPGALKNNSAITITSKTGPRPGPQRMIARPSMMGPNKISRPLLPGQKIADIRSRLNELRSYTSARPRPQISPGRLLRPSLPGSVSITKITKYPKKADSDNNSSVTRMDLDSDDDTHVVDSDDDDGSRKPNSKLDYRPPNLTSLQESASPNNEMQNEPRELKSELREPLVLTTHEKLPCEDALQNMSQVDNSITISPQKKTNRRKPAQPRPRTVKQMQMLQQTQQMGQPGTQVERSMLQGDRHIPQVDRPIYPLDKPLHQGERSLSKRERMLPQVDKSLPQSDRSVHQGDSLALQMEHLKPPSEQQTTPSDHDPHAVDPVERKTSLLKNYRHQRLGSRPQSESSLLQLERTTSVLNKEGMPDFRQNLDDITQSYSPTNEVKPGAKSKKKKSPNKIEGIIESHTNEKPPPSVGMSHSVSSLLGPTNNVQKSKRNEQNVVPVAPTDNSGAQRISGRPPMGGISSDASGMSYVQGLPGKPQVPQTMPPNIFHGESEKAVPSTAPHPQGPIVPGPQYPAPNATPEGHYAQYPGYGMGYGAYPNPAYYAGYGAAGYYPYGAAGAPPYPAPAPVTVPAAAHAPALAPVPAHTPTPEGFLPPNPQW